MPRETGRRTKSRTTRTLTSAWASASIYHAVANTTSSACPITVTLGDQNTAAATAYDVPFGTTTIDGRNGVAGSADTIDQLIDAGSITTTHANDIDINAFCAWGFTGESLGTLSNTNGSPVNDGPNNSGVHSLIGPAHQILTSTGAYHMTYTTTGGHNVGGAGAGVSYELWASPTLRRPRRRRRRR